MKIKLVPIRLSREKYRLIQHRLVDEDLSFQGLIEQLLDKHFLKQKHFKADSVRGKKQDDGIESGVLDGS